MMLPIKHALLAGAFLTLAGCASTGPFDPLAAFGPDKAEKKEAKDEDKSSVVAGLPKDIEGAVAQAQEQRKKGDLTAATRTLSQLVIIAPDDPRVLGEYGKTLAALGRSDDALAFLERAIELQPADWSLFSAQGVAYDQRGIYQAAQNSYARALQLRPGEPTVLSNNALSHMQAGDLNGAEKLLLQASQNGGDDPRIASNLALVQSLRAKGDETPAPETLAKGKTTPSTVAAEAAPTAEDVEEAPEATASEPAAPAAEVANSSPAPEGPEPASETTASASGEPAPESSQPDQTETPEAFAGEPLPIEEIEEGAVATDSATAPNPPAVQATPLAPVTEQARTDEAIDAVPGSNDAWQESLKADSLAQIQSDSTVKVQQVPKDTPAAPKRPAAKRTVAVAKPKPTKTATADVVGPPGSSTSFLRPAAGK